MEDKRNKVVENILEQMSNVDIANNNPYSVELYQLNLFKITNITVKLKKQIDFFHLRKDGNQ
jgi:hypothetical protein